MEAFCWRRLIIGGCFLLEKADHWWRPSAGEDLTFVSSLLEKVEACYWRRCGIENSLSIR